MKPNCQSKPRKPPKHTCGYKICSSASPSHCNNSDNYTGDVHCIASGNTIGKRVEVDWVDYKLQTRWLGSWTIAHVEAHWKMGDKVHYTPTGLQSVWTTICIWGPDHGWFFKHWWIGRTYKPVRNVGRLLPKSTKDGIHKLRRPPISLPGSIQRPWTVAPRWICVQFPMFC